MPLQKIMQISEVKRKGGRKLRRMSILNALQVKFAYAVTCHKAQGGQWDAVFIDQGYLVEEMITKEYLRWLYTAFYASCERIVFG